MHESISDARRFSQEELAGIPQLVADRIQRIRQGLISGAVADVEQERSQAYWRLRQLLLLARLFGGSVPSLSCLNKDRRKDVFAPNGIEPLSFDEAHGACDALAAWAEATISRRAVKPLQNESLIEMGGALPDLGDYMAAKNCRTAKINTHDKLLGAIRNGPLRTYRKSQRLYVHAGDWQRLVEAENIAVEQLLDSPQLADEIGEIADRMAEVRAKKVRRTVAE